MARDLYTRTVAGDAPFLVAEAKTWLKIPATVTSDDTNITALIAVALEHGENHTGRSFRVQTWELLTDSFCNPIELRRSPIDAITKVEHIVSGGLVEVSSDDYYLVNERWYSYVYLVSGAAWPTTTDDVLHAVKVTFTTAAWGDANTFKTAMKMHISHMYENRGDNEELSLANVRSAARTSRANFLYDSFAIPRT